MKKLNLGCGSDIKKDYTNLDYVKLPGVNVVHDIEKIPYPFKENTFDEIYCKDILEHVSDVPKVIKELHRILKKDGKIIIQVPHFTSCDNFGDITHKNMFSSCSFDSFLKKHLRAYYHSFHFISLKSKIVFRKKIYFLHNYLIEPLINISKQTKLYYETSGFCYCFPAFNLIFELKK